MIDRAEVRAWLFTLKRMAPDERRRVMRTLPQGMIDAIVEEWWWQAHGGQIEPEGDWRVWAMVAGRGFGKTRAGAEWVSQRARDDGAARIALVAASRDEVARVMVEGESGLLGIARSGEAPRWIASRRLLIFPSGARGIAYSAERPGTLRGPQHHFAWCDELAKWPRADETWDNLMMGLRLGGAPRTVVTTTPRPMPLLKRVLALPRCAATQGRTDENPHLPADFRAAVTEICGGTRLGRQELEGELFDDIAGALWTRAMLDQWRAAAVVPGTGAIGARFGRIVIGVDPPASIGGDACGIVVCGLGRDDTAYVLADHSAAGLSPNGWAGRVAEAAHLWGASRIVAEANQGGNMVESVLRAADAQLPVKPVHASAGKAARAEPVALRFEIGRARMAGSFPELEDELCALTFAGYQGAGRSPDRADAMVWAMAELASAGGEPSVRGL